MSKIDTAGYNHVQHKSSAKFPDKMEVWVSRDGKSWTMLGEEDKPKGMEPPPNWDHEFNEMYQLRVRIGQQKGYHRSRYGNKDGQAPDGSYRRFEDPMWKEIEDYLDEANGAIFKATQLLDQRMRDARNRAGRPSDLDTIGGASRGEGG